MTTFFVPLQPPSQNDLKVSPDGRGRWRYDNIKRAWSRWIPPLIRPKRAKGPVVMRVTRLMPRGRSFHAYDEANLQGGLKPVVDVLVQAGYLVDDRPGLLVPRYVQRRAEVGETPGTLFEFEPQGS